jgi:hypothetical protein
MFGIADDAAFWNVVLRFYDEDRLEAAQDVLDKLGDGVSGGVYLNLVRLVESELYTRVHGARKALAAWVDLEYLPHELEPSIGAIGQALMQVLDGERRRFAWKGSDRVLVTLMSADKDAPWATARFGYCAQKSDYYKICIPFHAVVDPHRFVSVLSHEFGHVISLSESKGRIATWLGEGFSVYASNDVQDHSRRMFLANPETWLKPEFLESQFRPSIDLGSREKWLAYQQSGWIVHYLAKLRGEPELMHLLTEFADESILRNLKLLALGQSKTRDAIAHAYGLTLEDLFRKAEEALSFA